MINNMFSSDSKRLEKSKEPALSPFMLSDRFLATERAACASLEMRLRNLAEKAAARSTFSGREKQLQWRGGGFLPSSSSTEEGQLSVIAV